MLYQAHIKSVKRILRIDSSGRRQGSVSRALAEHLSEQLRMRFPYAEVVTRDLNEGLGFVNEAWIEAAYTRSENRTAEHREILAVSDKLVDEFASADILVFTIPIYNFSVPASLKAWIDLVCRIGRTFRYTEEGPHSLLPNRKTYIIVTSGGTPIGSDIDYATDYFQHVLSFLGITDVKIVEADRLLFEGEAKIEQARRQIDALVAQLKLAATAT